jgi:Uncharacterized protein conserved in bacteria, putative virulence factor
LGPRAAHSPARAGCEGNDYHLVLALDTNLMPFAEGRPYLAPSGRDAEAGLVFSLANRLDAVNWFLGEEWVRLWIDELFREMLEHRQSRRVGRRRVDPSARRISPRSGRHRPGGASAALRRLSRSSRPDGNPAGKLSPGGCLLQAGSALHRLRSDPRCRQFPDLRLVVEREGSRADLSRAAKLELRDLSSPLQVYSDPFESRVEFARVTFGKNHLSHRSGRSDAFEWPTLARVGDEAKAGRPQGRQ